MTLECSGNRPQLSHGVIGNAKWAGTPLAPILEEAGLLDQGIEVVFFGSDEGGEEVREIKVKQNFARSMSLADAMNPKNLLCYEMNGAPLPQPISPHDTTFRHGYSEGRVAGEACLRRTCRLYGQPSRAHEGRGGKISAQHRLCRWQITPVPSPDPLHLFALPAHDFSQKSTYDDGTNFLP